MKKKTQSYRIPKGCKIRKAKNRDMILSRLFRYPIPGFCLKEYYDILEIPEDCSLNIEFLGIIRNKKRKKDG